MTRQRQVRLKTTFGISCRLAGGGRSAVWNGDRIYIIKRAGSHYLCCVMWNQNYEIVWLHKRAVRDKR